MDRAVSRRAVLGGAVAGLASACRSGKPTALPAASAVGAPSAVARSLESRLTGRVLRPGTPAYASAVRLYNPRYDGSTRPVAIARCVSEADVQACVRWAQETGTPLRVRSGGHSYGGWSSGPGLVVDLRPMRSVKVDGRTARIGGGALLGDVCGELAASGVALAAGSCPTVGLSGLTLGGGVGVLTRAFGLTCDAVRSARVVTADGRAADAAPDLLWALRGGGGSFGVVTSWDLDLRPAPTVVTFYLSWPLDHGEEVLDAWQRWAPVADRRLWSTCKLLVSTGRRRALVAGTWIGPPSSLDDQLAPLLRGLPAPTARSVRTRSYGDAMLFEAGCARLTTTSCITSALETPERQAFSATSLVLTQALPDVGAVAAAARRAGSVPGLSEGGLSFDALGGAVADVEPSATAFPWRQALATVQVTATWDHGPAGPFDDYVHAVRRDLLPQLGNHAYSNYADASLSDHGPAYWGVGYGRLREVKRAYDPHDLFRWPQSIKA